MSFELDYLAFKPFHHLHTNYKAEASNLETLKATASSLGIDKIRAQKLMDQLPHINEVLPDIIKDAIWKLQIISVLAQLYAMPTIEDAMLNEKISTYAIKAKLADYSLWGKDEIEVIEDKLNVEWVILMADNYGLGKFEAYAKILRDKITLKEEAKKQVKQYKDWEGHIARCNDIGIDNPGSYTEAHVLLAHGTWLKMKDMK